MSQTVQFIIAKRTRVDVQSEKRKRSKEGNGTSKKASSQQPALKEEGKYDK